MTHPSRLILVRLLPLCCAIACQGDPTTPDAVPAFAGGNVTAAVNTVASVTILPASQTVFLSDQFQLTAQPKNSAGQLLDRIPTWTVTKPSVASTVSPPGATMTFKALAVGTTTIKATVDTKFKYAKVVVRSVVGGKVLVTPSEATVATGGTVQFVAQGLTKTGETVAVNVTWTGSTGTISTAGVLTAGNTPGVYRVIATSAFGAADTSAVTVTTSDPVAAVILTPESASIATGGTVQFKAYGRNTAGDSVAVAVIYTATGGTIAGDLYTAGTTPGTYRVIATSAAGLADSAQVIVSGTQIARVSLLPDIAASRSGETTRFVASAWNTLGETVPGSFTYEATCGTVTAAGVFTAPQGVAGSCFVTASVEGKSATTEVVLLTNIPGQGIPFGISDLWISPTSMQSLGVATFTSSHDYILPNEFVSHISAARARGIHVLLSLTGGSHDRYKTAGVFDMGKWRATMDTYNTAAIRSAVADAVADGTIIGNTVMDEPQQSGTDSKAWGPEGTMTKIRVDSLCAYVKAAFPTLPMGVVHDQSIFQPDSSYRECEFFLSQYANRKGNVDAWRDAAVALAQRDGMKVIFSINLLDGGVQDRTGPLDCAGTGGLGTHGLNCQMTPTQVRDWGKKLGQVGCAMLSWRYDAAFVAKPENQAALSDIAIALSRLPRKPCGRDS